jgi:glutamate synthase (NADPH/NADH) small chain
MAGAEDSQSDPSRLTRLVVWAVREGRQAAHAIDKFLMGKTDLPR